MVKKSIGDILGGWAYLIGVILAIVVGVLGGMNLVDFNNIGISITLVIIGIIIGLFNIADKEAIPFLLSGAVLIIASGFGASMFLSLPAVSLTLIALLSIFVPATIIVAVKNVLILGKN